MGKQSSKDKPHRKGQKKHKQMFTEFATHQQKLVEEQALSRLIKPQTHTQMEVEDEQEEQMMLNGQDISKNRNINQVCLAVNSLIAKNKLSSKNAFEVPMIDLERMPDFENIYEDENAWRTLSSTLENDYKIYGYRVDAIHSIAFTMLNSMSRRQEDAVVEQTHFNQDSIQKPIDTVDHEAIHLDKREQAYNIDMQLQNIRFDPILERIRRQFDQNGLNSLLLHSLSVDRDLALTLVSKSQRERDSPHPYMPFDLQLPQEYSHNFMRMVSKVVKNIGSTVFAHDPNWLSEVKQLEMSEKDLINPSLVGIKSSNQVIDLDAESEMMDENEEDVVRIGILNAEGRSEKLKKESFGGESLSWMSDLDRKMLGLEPINTQTAKKVQKRQPTQNEVLFEEEFQDKAAVLAVESHKAEHRITIQDKFLVAKAVAQHFQEQISLITLREEIVDDIPMNPEELMEIQTFYRAIDVRHQHSSIKSMKESIKRIFDRSKVKPTFQNIYREYKRENQQISHTLCFLTLLHLANEHSLSLQCIEGEEDFFVR